MQNKVSTFREVSPPLAKKSRWLSATAARRQLIDGSVSHGSLSRWKEEEKENTTAAGARPFLRLRVVFVGLLGVVLVVVTAGCLERAARRYRMRGTPRALRDRATKSLARSAFELPLALSEKK